MAANKPGSKATPKATAKATKSRPAPKAAAATRTDDAPRNTSRRGLVEDQIFTEAARLFAERGFAGTSLQDVADAMGMTRPALYYYVKSKDELLARLVTETTEAPAAEIKRLATHPGSEPAARLRGVAHAIALRRANDPGRFQMLVRSEAELPDDLARSQRAAQRATLRELILLIEEGIEAGQFRPVDPRTTALAVIGMCNWIAWWQQSLGEHTPTEVAEQIADLALGMVRSPDGHLPGAIGPRAAIAQLRADLDYLERTLDQQKQSKTTEKPRARRRSG
ncbi:TetR/AcrR family transcriptional regulator [Mycobacterium sp.]|uniref:TetR/AcrR family transcriptional regulator n=1 Tax=Mycobacterium sp. TaxID=1785 RepID=UPI002D9427E5|nr:TetR/AcrR family transcriptional regulator [Mycobacterium sp.]